MKNPQALKLHACACDAPEHGKPLVSIEDALKLISAQVGPIGGFETLSLTAAKGRILAGPVVSRAMTPPFDNSAMDGYAVDSSAFVGAGPWILHVAERVPAGQAPRSKVAGRIASRIFTGAPLPDGADAVVMQEDTRRSGDAVLIDKRPLPGQHIRRAGEDMVPGATILAAGQLLGSREIAAAAAAGAGFLRVRRKIRVCLLVTGDELQKTGSDLARAQIWDVNTPMLCSELDIPAVEIVLVETGADSRAGLQQQLKRMADRADLVISSGGVSVGEEDHIKPAIEKIGGDIVFSGVAIKPGKPVSLGKLGDAFWLGLPGNSLSAFVTWQMFGTEILRRLTGQHPRVGPRQKVVLAKEVRRIPGRCELRLAEFAGFDDSGLHRVSFGDATYSGRVANLPDADGVVVLPADAAILPSGQVVEFLPFCNSWGKTWA